MDHINPAGRYSYPNPSLANQRLAPASTPAHPLNLQSDHISSASKHILDSIKKTGTSKQKTLAAHVTSSLEKNVLNAAGQSHLENEIVEYQQRVNISQNAQAIIKVNTKKNADLKYDILDIALLADKYPPFTLNLRHLLTQDQSNRPDNTQGPSAAYLTTQLAGESLRARLINQADPQYSAPSALNQHRTNTNDPVDPGIHRLSTSSHRLITEGLGRRARFEPYPSNLQRSHMNQPTQLASKKIKNVEHQQLINNLPEQLNEQHKLNISATLNYIEEQGMTWSHLRGSIDNARPNMLETVLNQAILQGSLNSHCLEALNHAFSLELRTTSDLLQGLPIQAEHRELLSKLPEKIDQSQRAEINRFFCHLEQHSLRWSSLLKDFINTRSKTTEAIVNSAIADHGLAPRLLPALNEAYDLKLRALKEKSKTSPVLSEHLQLMNSLHNNITPEQRSRINRFLCHLELLNKTWSSLRGEEHDLKPEALEAAVHNAITTHGLYKDTVYALNKAFTLFMSPPTGRKRLYPTYTEHQQLLESFSNSTIRVDKSLINRFLCHLEQRGMSWSRITAQSDESRPLDLEEAVNVAMRDYGLSTRTFSEINRVFSLSLKRYNT